MRLIENLLKDTYDEKYKVDQSKSRSNGIDAKSEILNEDK